MLSIVIPTYNSEFTILNCLNSILHQNFSSTKFEIIVIDDGSVDNTEIKVKEFIDSNEEIDVLYIKKVNGGVSSARNMGIREAKYDWVAFLDSDDIWLPNKISQQFDVIFKSKINIDLIGSARNDEVLNILGKKINTIHKATPLELLIKMYPQTSTVIVKKEMFNKVGYYDESFSHAEDGDMWLRICEKGDFFYLPESLVITGDRKPNFGVKGLSSNLPEMEKGQHKLLSKAKARGTISSDKYYVLKLFYFVKYIRRLILARYFRFKNF